MPRLCWGFKTIGFMIAGVSHGTKPFRSPCFGQCRSLLGLGSPSPRVQRASSPSANRQLIALFLPTADHSVIVASGRQRTAPLTVGSASRRRPVGPWALRAPARVTSVGNRPRPHHGGTHARRIHGTPTCHRAPPRRPTSPVDLPGPGPLRLLVPQVVAPLPRARRRP